MISRIHYRDAHGKLLWSEEMIFNRLWGGGDKFIRRGLEYKILRVAIANTIQHVNVKEVIQ